MIAQICLSTTLQLTMLQTQSNPSTEALKNIFNKPAENITVVLILAAVVVAVVVGIFYLIKTQCDKRAA